MFLLQNICYDFSLEPTCRDSSLEGSQHMFSLGNKKNYLWIVLNTPFNLELRCLDHTYCIKDIECFPLYTPSYLTENEYTFSMLY